MKLALLTLGLSYLFCLHPTFGQNSARPNIIFIMADDLGYGDLGSYGQDKIKTPHLDRLAREGVRFTQCYAGSPVCAPARSVLMTGQHTGHTTVRGNFGVRGVVGLGGGDGRVPLKADDITVAEMLQATGYHTAMFGKWGLGEPATSGEPHRQGFDEFYGYLNQRRAHSYYPDYLWNGTLRDSLPGNVNGQVTYSHDLFTQKALDFIRRQRQEPFFLYLPYTTPHDRYEIPDLFPYADSTHWGNDAQVHAAMVTRMDRDIGKLMHLLSSLQIRENTLIFFCSDNGAAQRWEGTFDSSGALRGRKRDLYEGGIRTPMIVSMPRTIPEGEVSHQPWHFMDVMPTLATFAETDPPSEIDGLDMSLHLKYPDLLVVDRVLYWEFYERGFQQAIRWNDWKGVRLDQDKPWELYNLKEDMKEAHNVADQNPLVVKRLNFIAEDQHRPSPYFLKNK